MLLLRSRNRILKKGYYNQRSPYMLCVCVCVSFFYYSVLTSKKKLLQAVIDDIVL